ncbi:MAG: tRNA (adenosine(37)-N6)-threonylcarbamoyltransferase complex ATPase subunit type 1 TsaE [Eubacteriales bacterium]|nr:tRNA (adenosine(37)-N6)-threonylcarbamoyltransferase complex ATPase subunit type 1 TsaE [Eubacteriales bacterium]
MIIETMHPDDTYRLAMKIAEQAKPGQLYTLNGDLGVGKTVFAQGMAAGLGIAEPVNSPTFTIVQEYRDGRLPLYHFDVYRIEEPEEMDEIGYEDYFFGNGISLVEWAVQIPELIPENAISVTIEKDPEKGFDYRKITIEGLESYDFLKELGEEE